MKAKVAMFLIFLSLSAVFVSARIELGGPTKERYNLGEEIDIKAIIKQESALQGFFKVSVVCNDYALMYYFTPLSLKQQVETEVSIPNFPLVEGMKGDCRVRAEYTKHDGTMIEWSESKTFSVTDKLKLEVILDEGSFKPTEDIIIAGTVKMDNGDNAPNASVMINLFDKDRNVDLKEGRFAYKTKVADYAEPGRYTLYAYAEDEYGNSADYTGYITIQGVPTRVKVVLDKENVKPGEKILVSPVLYDQTGDVISDSVVLEILGDDGAILTETITGDYEYTVKEYSSPDEITVKVSKEGLTAEKKFTIPEVRDIDVSMQGEIIVIKNIGNVDYKDTVSTNIEGGGKEYTISRYVSLKPGEEELIDLSEEVPKGSYEISVPSEGISLTGQVVNDNRGFIKKTGMDKLTGVVIGTKDSSKKRRAVLILFIIVIGIVAYYNKDILKKKIVGKFGKKRE